MKAHICLMPDQLLANFLPIQQLKPDVVLLVNTGYTLKNELDKRLTVLLNHPGIQVIKASELAPQDGFAQPPYARMEAPDARPRKATRKRIVKALGITLKQL